MLATLGSAYEVPVRQYLPQEYSPHFGIPLHTPVTGGVGESNNIHSRQEEIRGSILRGGKLMAHRDKLARPLIRLTRPPLACDCSPSHWTDEVVVSTWRVATVLSVRIGLSFRVAIVIGWLLGWPKEQILPGWLERNRSLSRPSPV